MKNIYDLESSLDIEGLEKIHFNICVGIAKSNLTPTTRIIPHHEQQGRFIEAIDYKNSEMARISAVADDAESFLSSEELHVYNTLTYVQKRNVLELYKQGFRDGDFVRLKMTKQEFLKDKFATFYDSKTEWVENHKNFPELVDWIKRLPFLEIGRVLIFVTKQYMHSDIHYDRRDDWMSGKHHFIWFNPFKMKKFFFVNGYEKEYVDTKAAFFTTDRLHGCEPVPYTAYSIRVDGQLTKEFCEQHNIEWCPR